MGEAAALCWCQHEGDVRGAEATAARDLEEEALLGPCWFLCGRTPLTLGMWLWLQTIPVSCVFCDPVHQEPAGHQRDSYCWG